MATNSFIALAEPLQKGLTKFDVNRVVRGSYCHNDGYLAHNGVLLLLYYDTVGKIENLLDLEDLSSLGYVIGKKHDLNKRMMDKEYKESVEFMTSAYKRDRGSYEDMSCVQYKGPIGNNPWEAWTYLYIPEDKKWYTTRDGKTWISVESLIIKDIPDIKDMLTRVSTSINREDKKAVDKLLAFANSVIEYRKNNPILPSYDTIYEKNNSRKYIAECIAQGRYWSDPIDMKVIHIESIEKAEGKAPNNKIVRFTYKTTLTGKTGKGGGLICTFCNRFLENEDIVLKNPSKLLPFCK